MNVLYVVRGYPGLGRVMGSLALDSSLRAINPRPRASHFASYLAGLRYLRNTGHSVIDLYPSGYYQRPNAFCSPFGCEADVIAQVAGERAIDLVVIDGEPLLIDFVASVLKLPVWVLTHPSDLDNPHSTPAGIELFRLYYSRANRVVAHGLGRLPPSRLALGGRAGMALEINTLVRPSIAAAGAARRRGFEMPPGLGHVVGVMGGGSENVVPAFAERTKALARLLVTACESSGVERLTVFCANRDLAQSMKGNAPASFVEFVEEPVDNSASLIAADLVVGRSGRNLVSEILTLGVPAIIVPVPSESYRYGDQIATARLAAGLSDGVRAFDLHDGEAVFTPLLADALRGPRSPATWVPGNEQIQAWLPEWTPA